MSGGGNVSAACASPPSTLLLVQRIPYRTPVGQASRLREPVLRSVVIAGVRRPVLWSLIPACDVWRVLHFQRRCGDREPTPLQRRSIGRTRTINSLREPRISLHARISSVACLGQSLPSPSCSPRKAASVSSCAIEMSSHGNILLQRSALPNSRRLRNSLRNATASDCAL